MSSTCSAASTSPRSAWRPRCESDALRALHPFSTQAMRPADSNNDDERSFLERHGLLIGIIAAVLIGGAVAAFRSLSTHHSSAPKMQEISMVKLLPPPPPPPPQQPPEEKMIEQTPVDQQEQKPEDKPAPAPDIGTNIKGDGPGDGFGLSGSNGNGLIGGGGHGGSRWGWYAGEVQSKIADALRSNPRTRSANLSIQVRIWADASGRITKVRLAGSTGDPALEDILRNQVLNGLQLPDAPPAGMPMPIVLRITERQPD